jgi:anthranilate synthase component 1
MISAEIAERPGRPTTSAERALAEFVVACDPAVEPEALFACLRDFYRERGSDCALFQKFASITNGHGTPQSGMVFEPTWGEAVDCVGDDLVGSLRAAFNRAGLDRRDRTPQRDVGFRGGLLGFISYDAHARAANPRLSFPALDTATTPDLVTLLVDKFLVFDPARGRLSLMSAATSDGPGTSELAEEARMMSEYIAVHYNAFDIEFSNDPLDYSGFDRMFDEAGYRRAFRLIQQHLRAGDAYQVLLSQRFSRAFSADGTRMFAALCRLNPMSSYVYYIDLKDRFGLFGTCGLCHIRRTTEQLSSVVFAGTRGRGGNEEEDGAIARELATNHKDRAEHLMLVDLERNDLARLSRPGSLQLSSYLDVSRFGTTQYLTTRIQSALRADLDDAALLVSTGPRGVVSGVPKRRALEIISEAEPERRRFYTGTVFCADYGGNLDSAIVITSAGIVDRTLHIQCGGGITVRSDEATEIAELNAKATSLVRAWTVAHD